MLLEQQLQRQFTGRGGGKAPGKKALKGQYPFSLLKHIQMSARELLSRSFAQHRVKDQNSNLLAFGNSLLNFNLREQDNSKMSNSASIKLIHDIISFEMSCCGTPTYPPAPQIYGSFCKANMHLVLVFCSIWEKQGKWAMVKKSRDISVSLLSAKTS